MSKTLAESAAEILKASMNAGKEPAATMPAEVEDLGGATNDNPAGNAVGSAAAAKKKEAPKPGAPGVPAEGSKKLAAEETEETSEDVLEEEIELTEEELDEYLDSLTEEELEALAEGELEEGNTKIPMPLLKKKAKMAEETEVDADSERAAYKADLVAKYRGSMKEDVDALFNGESLSEDFRVKATLIFEAAVQSRVEAIVEEVLDENDAVLEEAIQNVQAELSEQVDDYLNYVVEEWVEENQVAIETGLRAELVEDFIGGLKNLFAEHYIDIPDEKVDVAEALAAQVAELQQEAEETDNVLATLVEELGSIKKEKAIARICEGLTQVQTEKMKSLAEGVEFTAEGDFDNKLAVIRENYFPSKVSVKSEVKTLQETAVNEEPEVADVHGIMKHYVNAISKTAPKA